MVRCSHCGSLLCMESIQGKVIIKTCLTCGFITNSYMKSGSDYVKNQTEILPEIYKELIFIDDNKMVWMPNFTNIEDKGMLFIQGADKDSYKWAVIKNLPIPLEDQHKFPIPSQPGKHYKYKGDINTLKTFNPLEYIQAYYYLFNVDEE